MNASPHPGSKGQPETGTPSRHPSESWGPFSDVDLSIAPGAASTSACARAATHFAPPRQSGFTLVEMLVALLIFGMISAAAVSLLSFSVKSQEVAGARLAGLADLRRASAIMTADLAQAAPRVSRDEAGAVRPAFEGGGSDGEEPALVLVRHGWSNVDRSPRASLQKVAYRLNGSTLERLAYPHVDGAAPMPPLRLLDGVSALRLRFRAEDGAWRDRWDPVDIAALPVAAEAVLEMTDGTEIRQLFLVGAGA